VRRLWITAAGVLALVLAAPAGAATFTVTKTADTNDPACNADCSLREAIVAANGGTPGPDTIVLPAGNYVLTRTNSGVEDLAATGDLDIRDDVVISGAAAATTTVDASGLTGFPERVFDVRRNPNDSGPPSITATLRDLTITGGRTSSGDPGGAGLRAFGSALLERVVVTGNATSGPSEAGGGVSQDGAFPSLVTLRRTTVTKNQAAVGGGVGETGGAHSSSQVVGVLIEDSTISGNTATAGSAYSDGGGVAQDSIGDLKIRRSTITGNTVTGTDGFGGGVSSDANGFIDIVDTTISGNSASGLDSFGGGIGTNSGQTTLTNVTIADNAVTGSVRSPTFQPTHDAVNVAQNGGGTIASKNTIAGPGAPKSCNAAAAGSGTWTSHGNNVDSDGSCGFGTASDRPGVDPRLGPLQDNGGPTQTRALLAGSPAIGTGDNAACSLTDQRGVTRPAPLGSSCDAGAYEAVGPDLAVTVADDPDPVTAGQAVAYTATVTNAGPGEAPDAKITWTQPDGSVVESALGNVPAGGTPVTSRITFTPAAPGTATATATVSATGETNAADNQASQSTTVNAAPVSQPPAATPAPATPLPPPVAFQTANAEPVTGDVFVSVPTPARSRAYVPGARPKGRTFIPLRQARQLPVGTIFDTRRGRVRIATATLTRSVTQSAQFFEGVFQLLQKRQERGLAEARLTGSTFSACPKTTGKARARAAARKRLSNKALRTLRANAKGKFRTRGRFAAATVRGTEWGMIDRCDGTLTRVRRGVVVVRDIAAKRNITVRTGKTKLVPRR
jgi:CSLREA domain-containing protein